MACAVAGAPALNVAASTGVEHAVSVAPLALAGPSMQLKATAIAVGQFYSCALTTETTVKCWGDDLHGQLGDGQSGAGTLSSTPVQVTGLISVTAIAAGGYHTCALLEDGTVKCWGFNNFGQLGNGASGAGIATPVSVIGLTGVTAITAGDAHTCALAGGSVYCWGQSQYGRLGNGNLSSGINNTPVAVSNLLSVTAIAAGGGHTCALKLGGSVQCWGYNLYGQLGDGLKLNLSSPMTDTGLISATAVIAGGYHSCALTDIHGVKCWGDNAEGQLGDNSAPTNHLTPVDVINLTSGVSAITGGRSHTCALMTSTGVKCWGSNQKGQLGDGTNVTQENYPTNNVSGLSSGVKSIAGGTLSNQHTCALLLSGSVMCWGYNYYGQLGNGASGAGTDSNTPVDVADFLTRIFLPMVMVSP